MPDLARTLGRAQARVEALLLDTCRIDKDPAGKADDTLNEDTGLLEPPEADSKTTYRGPCAILAETDRASKHAAAELGQEPFPARDPDYAVLLPLAAPDVQVGNIVVVLTSKRDPKLVGRRFRVSQDQPVMTFAVVRKVPLEVAP